jgi:hypothetical protein
MLASLCTDKAIQPRKVRPMRTKWIVSMLIAVLVGGGGYWYYQHKYRHVANPTSEKLALVAYTGGCYGGSCNGKDPSDYCTDGRTVAAMKAPDGMLELRYSPSCRANWGRYTPYGRNVGYYTKYQQTIYARVTAWNPGGQSYGTAHRSWVNSTWSRMADGRGTACTGVEVVIINQGGDDYKIANEYPDGQPDFSGEADSLGWTWGPCR